MAERTTVSIKLEGMTELVAAIRRLPIAVRGEVLEHAVKMGAQVIGQAVSERAGVFRSRTGKLLRAIRQGVTLASQAMIRTLARSPEYVLIEVWPRLPYTHLVAGGHRIVARGPGRKEGVAGRTGRRAELRRALLARRAQGARGMVAPRDFMGPAFDATKEQAADRVLNELWRGIERAWTGGR